MTDFISKDSSFHIIISNAKPNAWSDVVWTDAKEAGAIVHLDYCKPLTHWLRRLRQLHFSNRLNRKVWLPLKSLWDWSNVIKPDDLDSSKRNFIIFQTGVKFSPNSIEKLKRECNASVILYMPDTLSTIGISDNKDELQRYIKHYHIDDVYSFDPHDCKEYGLKFFDFYSIIGNTPDPKDMGSERETLNNGDKKRVLYVGNARTPERLAMAHAIYKQLSGQCGCTFYLNGVSDADQIYKGITYNHPLTYPEVVELVKHSDAIVEIMNGSQSGNTLRGKEAICYNKQLITNNAEMLHSPYYSSNHILFYNKPSDIDLSLLSSHQPSYNYKGEFSPKRLLEMIVDNDRKE